MLKQDSLKQDLFKIRTLGELRAAGVEVLPVRLEMRRNLLERLRARERILPGIIGYDQSVLPEIENGVLAGHHMIFLGERGQAKSRLIRLLADLLDERVAAVKGCEINDDPYRPICGACRRRAAEFGEELEIEWIGRERRYAEKLATPDVSVADLIGEIDPIKVAEGRYLADEETIHYGLIPRTNRGIFAINELPDLTEKVQVGLFNLMEEKDVQIKGYRVRLPLDLVFVASANPEDYTSRGRIITPLKDRFDIQIRTHYPRTIEDEIAIMDQECGYPASVGMALRVPPFIKEVVAQLTFEARASNEINQSSGVSVRVSINNFESVHLQRREARGAPGRQRDRAASFRPAFALRLDRGQDRTRVRGRGQEGGGPHRTPGQPRRAQGLRSLFQDRRLAPRGRLLRGRMGRRGLRRRAGLRLP